MAEATEVSQSPDNACNFEADNKSQISKSSAQAHPLCSPCRWQKTSPHFQWSTTQETPPKPEDLVGAVEQSSEAEVSVEEHKEEDEVVVSRELAKPSPKEDKINITTSEVAEVAEAAVGLAGETMTSHSETEIPLSRFVLAGL